MACGASAMPSTRGAISRRHHDLCRPVGGTVEPVATRVRSTDVPPGRADDSHHSKFANRSAFLSEFRFRDLPKLLSCSHIVMRVVDCPVDRLVVATECMLASAYISITVTPYRNTAVIPPVTASSSFSVKDRVSWLFVVFISFLAVADRTGTSAGWTFTGRSCRYRAPLGTCTPCNRARSPLSQSSCPRTGKPSPSPLLRQRQVPRQSTTLLPGYSCSWSSRCCGSE